MSNLPSKISCNCGVYRLIDRKTGLFYVGSSTELPRREWRHFHDFGRRANAKLLQAAYDAGAQFEFEVLLLCDPDVRILRERDFVELLLPTLNYQRIVTTTVKHRDNGHVKSGAKQRAKGADHHSKRPEVAAKISAAKKAFLEANPDKNPMKRPEVAAKFMGDKSPMRRPEVAAKISAVMKGRPKSPEQRAKQSAAMKAMWAARRANLQPREHNVGT